MSIGHPKTILQLVFLTYGTLAKCVDHKYQIPIYSSQLISKPTLCACAMILQAPPIHSSHWQGLGQRAMAESQATALRKEGEGDDTSFIRTVSSSI